jgi:choline dehydrogenase
VNVTVSLTAISHNLVIAKVKPEASTSDISNDIAVLMDEQNKFFFEGFTERWHSRWSATSGCTNCFQQMTNEELTNIGAQQLINQFPGQAHMEFLWECIAYPGGANQFFIPLPNETYMSLTASNLAAVSQGNVTIGSRSILDYPIINPNVSFDPSSFH